MWRDNQSPRLKDAPVRARRDVDSRIRTEAGAARACARSGALLQWPCLIQMFCLSPDRSYGGRYNDEAKRHALERISNLPDAGDAEACELWQKVADAIDE